MSRPEYSRQGEEIRILDEKTVNQIAAGEVVERPASIVKELIENAIDAGATDVTIAIRAGRTDITSITVTDDGIGMRKGDIPLAFTPHATSKIRSADDLSRCISLGFRGEALASIASVACVTLRTRARGRDSSTGEEPENGSEYIISAGQVISAREIGSPAGTSIGIENIFYNTPARKKFQKTVATETARIADVIEGFAILYPSITFRYRLNKVLKISTHGCSTLKEVLQTLYPADMQHMIPLSRKRDGMGLTGYISLPSLYRQSSRRIMISVNGRRIQSLSIQQAIRRGYHTLLMPKLFPVAILGISLNPADVDVNVHPTKREVRFSYEPAVLSAISETVEETLFAQNLIPVSSAKPIFLSLPDRQDETQKELPQPPRTEKEPVLYRNYQQQVTPAFAESGVYEVSPVRLRRSGYQLRQTQLPCTNSVPVHDIPRLIYIGQIDATYLVASTAEGGMVLVDQHAAHERIRFDQIRMAANESPQSQELIVPRILSLSLPETAVMRNALPVLAEIGFIIESFGKDTYQVRAVPVMLNRQEEIGIIHEILDALIEEKIKKPEMMRDVIERMIACRGAIKAGTILLPHQAEELLSQLVQTTAPYTCPHGRPTMIQFPASHLQKMFHRI
ncbi:MAG: DNA mismatch repair endonuclease MutL [Methanospirillaceae archaeon]|nr:DNA mismatch repair endonuclease MutL [Methanospirillaceae archaeon]